MDVLIIPITLADDKKARVKALVFHTGDLINCIEDVIIILMYFIELFS